MRLVLKILFFLCLLQPGMVSSQSIAYKKYSIKDGLPGNNVFRIYQDKHGHIWISCDYGLSRFDGYIFKNYTYEHINGTALSIDEDGDELWISVPHTFQYLISKNGPKEYRPLKGQIAPTVIKMQIDDNKRRWLLNTGHYIQYVENGIVHTLFTKNKAGKLLNVNDIFYTTHTGLLIATDNGVYKVNPNKTLSIYNTVLPNRPAYCINTDRDGNTYMGFEGNIFIIGKNGTKGIPIQDNKKVIKLCAYDTSKIWFLTPEPDLRFIDNNMESSISESMGLKNVFFNDIYCDKTGLLFLATNGEGLYTLYNTNTIYYNGENGLSGNSVFTLCDTKEEVFIGSRGDINVYKDGEISKIDIPVKVDEKINAILNIGNDLWVATPFNIYKYSLSTHKYISFFPGAICLALDENGDILAGGYDKIYMLDKNINKACTLDRFFPKISGKRVNSILYDENGAYWFGANKGLTLFKNNDTTIFADTIATGTKVVGNNIVKDNKENIWFATSRGAFVYSKKNGWKIYRAKDGLPDNVALSLTPDKERMLIGTSRGLSSFDGKSFTQYTPEHGFPINEINAILVKEKDAFLGTSEGLYICRNYAIKSELPLPVVEFTSFRYNDSIITPRDTLTVPYSNKSLMINFTAVEYRRQEYIVYEYNIGSNNWYEIKTGLLPLTSLSPGTYTIEVRTKHKTTGKVSAAKSITVIVLPPFWQRWWFVILCILFVILTGSFLISRRIRRIKQKEKIRLQRYTRLLQLKQQATNALMSPHFIFNALNSIQHFINQSDALSANRFLSKFARMIRTTMENSARLNIKLKEEIELLELYLSLEAIRLNGKLSYEIRVDETLDKEQVLLPSILIQPYVENAVWHGIVPKESPGKIIVEIKRLTNSFLSITIQDDGVGIDLSPVPKEGKHKSLALKLNEDRLKMIEKMTGKKVSFSIEALYDAEGRKAGTLIRIELPINLA